MDHQKPQLSWHNNPHRQVGAGHLLRVIRAESAKNRIGQARKKHQPGHRSMADK
jgi:hypothetical protein